MKSKIIKLLQEKYDKTYQWISVVDLKNALNLPISELKAILTELYQDKKIVVRQGINGKLIYLKKNHGKSPNNIRSSNSPWNANYEVLL